MADPHVISALVRRYRVTMGALEKAEADVQAHHEALVHLEAVLRMFRADWNGRRFARSGCARRRVGRGGASILNVLREAQEPLTTHDIVRRCYARLGMPQPDAATLRDAAAPVHKMLRNRAGIVAHPDKPKRWTLARSPHN